MKVSEIRSMSIAEAKKHLEELMSELAKERAVAAGGTRPENPGKIRGLRKTVARILTIINEKKAKGETEEKPEEKGKTESEAKAQTKKAGKEKSKKAAKKINEKKKPNRKQKKGTVKKTAGKKKAVKKKGKKKEVKRG